MNTKYTYIREPDFLVRYVSWPPKDEIHYVCFELNIEKIKSFIFCYEFNKKRQSWK